MHIDEGEFALFGIEEKHYRDCKEDISDSCVLLDIWVTGKWEGYAHVIQISTASATA